MRVHILIVATLALVCSRPVAADTPADIAALEQAWGQAFLKGNRAFLEQLIAPEFKLMRAENNQTLITPRTQWFEVYERYIFHEFDVRTVNVVDAGDTAVATIAGRWKVGMRGREGAREEYFIISDTFVRRADGWKVVYRHSTPFAAKLAP